MSENSIPVVWRSYRRETPSDGYWDYTILHDLLDGVLWRPCLFPGFLNLERCEVGAVVALAGRHHADPSYVEALNRELSSWPWVVLFLMGDEESAFPLHLLRHPNVRIWRQTPRPDDPHVHRRLLNGYPPHAKLLDGQPCPDKDLDWFFAGQVTHPRRLECVGALRGLEGGALLETAGFTEGMFTKDYVSKMARSKVAPCPSGPVTPDSFRFAEALEAGCVPLADGKTSTVYPDGYWQKTLGDEDLPFPVVESWSDLPRLMSQELARWPANANRIGAWWLDRKRKMAYDLKRDLQVLTQGSAQPSCLDDQVTVIIFTSPHPACPSTEHIDRVVASIRRHFPLAEVLILCDGMRPDLEHRRRDYEEYLRRLVWKCGHAWHNVLPLVFDEHLHQVKMARVALENDRWVETPLLLMVEHDTPLVGPGDYVSWEGIQPDTARAIEWDAIFRMVLSGEANMVRLYHRAGGIPKEHEWLMDGTMERHGTQFVRTRQWSQRPHIASTEFYRRILLDYFSAQARTFIEDGMQTKICDRPWEAHKLVIYWPSDRESMRSLHSEARCGPDGKWDDKGEASLVF